MGNMKRLHEALQETEQALRDYDPLSFENVKKIVEAAQAIALASLPPRTVTPTEDHAHIPHCEYCGKINTENSFWIGAKLDEDLGFTMVEGTAKMACAACYPIATEEADKAMA